MSIDNVYLEVPHSNGGVSFIFEEVDNNPVKLKGDGRRGSDVTKLIYDNMYMNSFHSYIKSALTSNRIVWGQSADFYFGKTLPLIFYYRLINIMYNLSLDNKAKVYNALHAVYGSNYTFAGILCYGKYDEESIVFEFVSARDPKLHIEVFSNRVIFRPFDKDAVSLEGFIAMIKNGAMEIIAEPPRPIIPTPIVHTPEILKNHYGITDTANMITSDISLVPIDVMNLNISSIRKRKELLKLLQTQEIIFRSHITYGTRLPNVTYVQATHHAEIDIYDKITGIYLDTVFIVDNNVFYLSTFDTKYGNIFKSEIVNGKETYVAETFYDLYTDYLYHTVYDPLSDTPDIQYKGGEVCFKVSAMFKK